MYQCRSSTRCDHWPKFALKMEIRGISHLNQPIHQSVDLIVILWVVRIYNMRYRRYICQKWYPAHTFLQNVIPTLVDALLTPPPRNSAEIISPSVNRFLEIPIASVCRSVVCHLSKAIDKFQLYYSKCIKIFGKKNVEWNMEFLAVWYR